MSDNKTPGLPFLFAQWQRADLAVSAVEVAGSDLPFGPLSEAQDEALRTAMVLRDAIAETMLTAPADQNGGAWRLIFIAERMEQLHVKQELTSRLRERAALIRGAAS
jgi:hypothetical protein